MIVEMHCHTAEHSACSHVTALDQVLQREIALIRARPEILVQGHGDFHPRNIFLGRSKPDGGECITAIDFGSSYQLPRAFDVGTFLAQYVSMFLHHPHVQRKAPPLVFLHMYFDKTQDLEEDFMAQVDLYRARTCLSILYYFARLRMGDSEDFWRVLIEAERSLAAVAAGRAVGAGGPHTPA